MPNAARRVVVEGRAYDENGNLILHPPGGTPVTDDQIDVIGGGEPTPPTDLTAINAQLADHEARIAALEAAP